MVRLVTYKRTSLVIFLGVTVLSAACAAMRPPNAGGPDVGQPYPIVVSEQPQRREASVLALNRLAPGNLQQDQANVHLQPVTATIKSLPANLSTPLLLPKVGTAAEMNEEETREALRRFIDDWRNLIGASPLQLSLANRTDRPDGIKIATYEQRPFRYPLRGDFGKLEIQFTANRRLVNVSSSCIPDAERLQAALTATALRVKPEEAVERLLSENVTYVDAQGNQHTYRLSETNKVTPGEVVTFVRASKDRSDILELYVAWEINVADAPFKYVYIDAITNDIIATR